MLKAASDLLPRLVPPSIPVKRISTVNSEQVFKEEDLANLEERIVNRLTTALQLPKSNTALHGGITDANDTSNMHRNNRDNRKASSGSQFISPPACFVCGSLLHLARSCNYKNACRRCWKDGHRTRSCPEPKPSECPLNLKELGETNSNNQ